MANKESLNEEIDEIVSYHIQSIGNVFDDLKKAVAADTPSSSSDSEEPIVLHERINIAQQR